ncbi:MAG: (d)CMP kinase [Mycoplasma sp.]|nr:(d)CMP kinase [Mycoplasma sp.]
MSDENTRSKKWEKYRAEINHNINLFKLVEDSNNTLKVLKKRLLKIFPNYDQIFPSKFEKFDLKLKNINRPKIIDNRILIQSLKELENLKEELNSQVINNYENLNFESSVLDNVLNSIVNTKKEWKMIEKQIKTNSFFSIAIDGPSSAGKSTIARLLAKNNNFFFLNTGLVYRAIALECINKNVDLNDQEQIEKILQDNMIELFPNERVSLWNQDVTFELRKNTISTLSSKISVFPIVRKYAQTIQKKYINKNNVIAEGRDTTYNLLPNAPLKIYLDTKVEIRAKRRWLENQKLGYITDFDEILKQIKERDHRDINRKVDPLKKVEDVIYIDASNYNIEQVVEQIQALIDDYFKNLKNNE